MVIRGSLILNGKTLRFTDIKSLHEAENQIREYINWVSLAPEFLTKDDPPKRSFKRAAGSNMKLNEENVRKIKQMLHEDVLSMSDIAKRFCVSTSAIYHIKIGRNWSHIVTEEEE